jgi:hypothetical protein
VTDNVAASMPDDLKDAKNAVSALKVQRDSHRRENIRLDAENRWLRKHQAEIREWLAYAIGEWNTTRTLATGDALIQKADDLLREAEAQQR